MSSVYRYYLYEHHLYRVHAISKNSAYVQRYAFGLGYIDSGSLPDPQSDGIEISKRDAEAMIIRLATSKPAS